MNEFLKEVVTQGEVLKSCLDKYLKEENESFNRIVNIFKEKKLKKVLFVGMGCSLYAPHNVVDYLTSREIPALVLNAYEASRYQFGHITSDTLVVAISQSGESAEVIELTQKAKKITTVVGIVNKKGSSLDKILDHRLWMYAGEERTIANKSYLCTLAILNILSAALVEELNHDFVTQLYDSAEWISTFLKNSIDNTESIYNFVKDSTSYDFIGNGPSISTAMQCAMTFRDGQNIHTTAINCADYSHGWYASVKEGYLGVIFAPYFKEDSVEVKMVDKIISKGGKVLLVTSANVKSNENMMVINHPTVMENIAPLLQIIPCNTLLGWTLGEGWTR